MKKLTLNILLLTVSVAIALSSCKKKEEVEPDYSELSQQSSDNSTVQRESDQAIDDATKLLEGSSLSGARLDASTNDSCKIDSTNKKKFIFEYFAKNSLDKIKTGKITAVLTSGESFADKGSILTLTFDDLKVTRKGKSVTFKGTKTITNVTGGKVKNLTLGSDSIVHQILASNLTITFEDGTSKTWNVSKTRTFVQTDGGMFVKVKGTGSMLGYTNLSEWGTSRKGTMFYTSIDSPIVFAKCNDEIKPISGIKSHKGLIKEVKVTFGVTNLGESVSMIDGCSAFGMKINWINRKGENQSSIISY